VIVWLVFEIEGHDNHEVSGVFASKQAAEQWIAAQKTHCLSSSKIG